MPTDEDTLHVIAAQYDNTDRALADYEAIKALYKTVESSHAFDAAVVEKQPDGDVKIVKKHEQPTRHGSARGLRWGLGVGVVAALFPPVGIGIAAAGAGGAAIGAVAGHVSGGMSRSDLKELGEVLDAGTAGLVVVYDASMSEQVTSTLKAANRVVSKSTDMASEQLAADLKRAEEAPSVISLPQETTAGTSG